MKKLLLSLMLGLSTLASAFAEIKTVTQEGIAYIGNGITVEAAQNVAINDARQKALNELGAFIESNQSVTNGRLTKQELSSITGAIMKSKVLSSKKEISGEFIVVKTQVQFDIDMASFNQAIKKYQDSSEAKATIQN